MEEIKTIKTKQDFLNFIRLFIDDYSNNKEAWENRDIGSFLEGMESWVEDMEGYYENTNQPIPKKY